MKRQESLARAKLLAQKKNSKNDLSAKKPRYARETASMLLGQEKSSVKSRALLSKRTINENSVSAFSLKDNNERSAQKTSVKDHLYSTSTVKEQPSI